MELLSEKEIEEIVKRLGYSKVLDWKIKQFSNEIVGYLGEHLTLLIDIQTEKATKRLKCFVKCLPRSDEWKANYIRELLFFKKEYVMLTDLFRYFEQGKHKWRPTPLLVKEDVFVFEDVKEMGYEMPNNRYTLSLDALKASVVTLARFHAQSYIFEENRSAKLNKTYRIWDEYSDYLKESENNKNWRNAGRNAVVDFLKVYSQQNSNQIFIENIESIVTVLFDKAFALMKPSSKYRNTVVHRDLWTNNIFLKRDISGTVVDALIIDFQTVIYCPPMLDLSSLIFLNTTRDVRESSSDELKNVYYDTLSKELEASNIDVNTIMDRDTLEICYEESIPFAITQASLIIPITVMKTATREKIFCTSENSYRINEVARGAEFIETAKDDAHYRYRVTELFEEIVDRYVCPNSIK